MSTHDHIAGEQCRACGGRIDGHGILEDPDQDGLGASGIAQNRPVVIA